MNTYIERTCTEVGVKNKEGASLEDYRQRDAYVLLGGPGSGKTRSFREEAQRTEGAYIAAHDFVELNRPDEWHDKVLFIDGLDELRASSPAPEPLGLIRARLDELGKPRFRLSCRDADWFDMLDPDDLSKVSRNGHVTTLKLDPLSDSQVSEFLAALGVDDLDHEDDTALLLRNPLSLEHLVRAVAGGEKPQSRKETFEASCRLLLDEDNQRHARGRENRSFGAGERLDAAGHLCAVALLAGKRGYVRAATKADAHWTAIEDMPGCRRLIDAVLRTRLFESAADGQFTPLHHHIAEYLAGRHLANRVAADLPIGRAKALMTGFDGDVVAALRGVWAWFAAHCVAARTELIDADPLGTVLYGDVKQFSTSEKQRLLNGIRRRSEELNDLPVDSWSSPRWADVATDDMATLFWDVFKKAPDSEGGQRVALLLTEAPDRRTFPALRPLLLSIVRDEGLWDTTRQRALGWLINQFQGARTLQDDLSRLLDDIAAGRLTDSEDELTGRLLCELYPHRVSLADAKDFLHTPKDPALSGHFRYFWTTFVQEKAVPSARDEAKQLVAKFTRLANGAFSDDGVARPWITL